jgi:hypothetical protein
MLTSRNHHSVGMGGITEIATSAPGYNSIRPNTAAPLAETLKLNEVVVREAASARRPGAERAERTRLPDRHLVALAELRGRIAGASGEGTPQGTFNEAIALNGTAGIETAEFMSERIEQFGTPSRRTATGCTT